MKPITIKVILIILLVILNIADMTTAYLAQHEILEMNPIVAFTGSMTLLLIFKIAVLIGMVLFVAVNKWSSERLMFFFIMAVTYFIFFLIFGVYTNVTNLVDPIPPEQIEQVREIVTTSVKLVNYAQVSKTYYIRPVFLGFIAFMIFEWLYPSAKFRKERLKKDE